MQEEEMRLLPKSLMIKKNLRIYTTLDRLAGLLPRVLILQRDLFQDGLCITVLKEERQTLMKEPLIKSVEKSRKLLILLKKYTQMRF